MVTMAYKWGGYSLLTISNDPSTQFPWQTKITGFIYADEAAPVSSCVLRLDGWLGGTWPEGRGG